MFYVCQASLKKTTPTGVPNENFFYSKNRFFKKIKLIKANFQKKSSNKKPSFMKKKKSSSILYYDDDGEDDDEFGRKSQATLRLYDAY